MSLMTVQCRLVAPSATRQQLWCLMAERNTPLIDELLLQMRQHPDLPTWRQRGKVPAGIVKKLCEPLRTDDRFVGQPGRFYTSAIALVEYIYKSWLKLRQRLQYRLRGQLHWRDMLKSDEELVAQCDCPLETIQAEATAILNSVKSQIEASDEQNKNRKTVSRSLFNAYDVEKDPLKCSAICYLLKNGCKLPQKSEDPKKFAERRRKVNIKIERLTKQLKGHFPKGRDLTGEQWLEILHTATETAPANEAEARSWQDVLATRPQSVPYPIFYETNEDMTWSKNEKGRLCVRFNGLGEHQFAIYCDQRHLKWFERFLEDQEVKRQSKNQHSSALFTLRSGRISWQEGEGKGNPWEVHRLTLFCTVDTRLWSAEGTETIRQEKAGEVAKILTKMQEKGDLSDKQEAFIKRKTTSLERLDNPFPRPSQPLYKGQSHILVGVAFGLDKPATAAVIDGTTGEAIAYCSVRQLLGEDDYKLLNRQRYQKQRQAHKRHIAQRKGAPNQFGESNLGEYVNRLLAKAIVSLAKTHHAGSIVLPRLGDIREIVQAEIQARAEQKIPGYIEGQEEYAKQYRVNIHQWSYGRLSASIRAKASQLGISIEEIPQPLKGTPEEKALELALLAYQSRLTASGCV